MSEVDLVPAPGQILTIKGLNGRFRIKELHASLSPNSFARVMIGELEASSDYWVLGVQEVWSDEQEKWVWISNRAYPISFLRGKLGKGLLKVVVEPSLSMSTYPHQTLTIEDRQVKILSIQENWVAYKRLYTTKAGELGKKLQWVGLSLLLIGLIISIILDLRGSDLVNDSILITIAIGGLTTLIGIYLMILDEALDCMPTPQVYNQATSDK